MLACGTPNAEDDSDHWSDSDGDHYESKNNELNDPTAQMMEASVPACLSVCLSTRTVPRRRYIIHICLFCPQTVPFQIAQFNRRLGQRTGMNVKRGSKDDLSWSDEVEELVVKFKVRSYVPLCHLYTCLLRSFLVIGRCASFVK